MQKTIFKLADIFATPLAFVVLMSCSLVASFLGTFTNLGDSYMAAVNLALSVLTLGIGQAVLVSSARDNKALHLKLDKLILAAPTDNDAIGAEHRKSEHLDQQIKDIEIHSKQ